MAVTDETETLRIIKELVAACEEEIGDPAQAAVLRSEISRRLTPRIATSVIDTAQFCRAFALGAADAVARDPGPWPTDTLAQLAEMCFHNGDLSEAEELLRECASRDPQ